MIQQHTIYHTFLATLGVFAVSVTSALAYNGACVDYSTVGMSNCNGQPKEEEKPASLLPPPQEEKAPSPPPPTKSDLDKRVDEFYDRYDKPPEEFVRFSLEPTLENAIEWARKNDEIMRKNRQLARAWDQAREIYKAQNEETGTADKQLVPDFAYAMPQGFDAFRAAAGAFQNRGNVNAFKNPNPNPNITLPGQAARPLDSDIQGVEDGSVLEVSYYFSADCPYCQRFEPNFQQVIEELGDRIDVTCVDMTPAGQSEQNIYGKIDCDWRPLQPGEMDTFGIKSTPTLIVKRSENEPLQRLAGVVSADVLKKFFVEGPPKRNE